MYATTSGGGANGAICSGPFVPGCGTIFKITPSGTLTTLYSFCSQTECTDGYAPLAGLIQATNGDLYGTTSSGGGAAIQGTVFQITPSGSLTTLESFGRTLESGSVAALVQANGYLYGTTRQGGAYGSGSVFEIAPSGALTTIYSFCSQSGCPDGSYLIAGLVEATDGNLYGTTSTGGANNGGTIFKITPSGTLTTLYSFSRADGWNPQAGLVQATNGDFYGTTGSGGGDGNNGAIFRLSVGLGPFVKTVPGAGVAGGCPDSGVRTDRSHQRHI